MCVYTSVPACTRTVGWVVQSGAHPGSGSIVPLPHHTHHYPALHGHYCHAHPNHTHPCHAHSCHANNSREKRPCSCRRYRGDRIIRGSVALVSTSVTVQGRACSSNATTGTYVHTYILGHIPSIEARLTRSIVPLPHYIRHYQALKSYFRSTYLLLFIGGLIELSAM